VDSTAREQIQSKAPDAMDIEIVRELFLRTLDAGRILGEHSGFLNQVRGRMDKLPNYAVGKHGQLQEWILTSPSPDIGTLPISGHCSSGGR
jgi:hypothetical protein